MMYAMSSGAGAADTNPDWPSAGESVWVSRSMTARPKPSSRPLRSVVVMAATGAASLTMNSRRDAGTAGSTGR
ncbi:Uncharacterised protein [Mycobacteroides abscessus]|nr:Uncharacterised protein [Mycobacteroides abscessus]SKT79624.1 Uncharacterised protein [Mycobacteroides abscessus subsp. abscessus]